MLRRRAAEVPIDEIAGVGITNLIAALREALVKVPGVGVAAPQIGVPRRVVLVQDLESFHETIPPERLVELERSPIDPYVLINPELELVGEEKRTFFEGCLSVGGGKLCALVRRHRTVRVRYFDPDGNPHEDIRSGWHARILQHEVDHLNGTLYVDTMLSRTLMTSKHRTRWAHLPTADVLSAFEVSS